MAKKLATGGGDEGGNPGRLFCEICIMRCTATGCLSLCVCVCERERMLRLLVLGIFLRFIFFFGFRSAGSIPVKTMDAASADSYFDLCEIVCM